MKPTRFLKGCIVAALALAAVTVGAQSSFAADVYLVASRFDKTITLPGGGTVTVPMWGFAEVSAAEFATSTGTPTVPGPRIVVSPEDPVLRVHLRNTLPVPISIVIRGQDGAIQPVPATGRARSWTAETQPGGQSTYTFDNVRPGTYLYHSGTHAAVQVQMGLYGAMTKDAGAGLAYPGVSYEADAVVVYSEIDPSLNTAVVTGQYAGIPVTAGGTVPAGPMTSTIDHMPRYFMVNGESYPVVAPLQAQANQAVLLRFVNAGLRAHVPSLLADTNGVSAAAVETPLMNLVAEDGFPGPGSNAATGAPPYPRFQSTVFLPAGKTVDALWLPTAPGRYPLYDRRLNLTAGGQGNGGMLTYVEVVSGSGPAPVGVADAYTTNEDEALTVGVPGVLGNDTWEDPATVLNAVVVSHPARGVLALNADGSFTYQPNANVHGTDSFSYRAVAGGASSVPTEVTIAITPVNDAPVANPQTVNVAFQAATPVTLTGSDIDGDLITFVVVTEPANGLLSGVPPALTYTPNSGFSGPDSFTFTVRDGTLESPPATVSITVRPNAAPVANDDLATTVQNTSVAIPILANDSDTDGTLNPTTVTIVTEPSRRGTVTVNTTTGVVTYTPRRNFRGTDTFTYTVRDNLGTVSNIATVRVNVTR